MAPKRNDCLSFKIHINITILRTLHCIPHKNICFTIMYIYITPTSLICGNKIHLYYNIQFYKGTFCVFGYSFKILIFALFLSSYLYLIFVFYIYFTYMVNNRQWKSHRRWFIFYYLYIYYILVLQLSAVENLYIWRFFRCELVTDRHDDLEMSDVSYFNIHKDSDKR